MGVLLHAGEPHPPRAGGAGAGPSGHSWASRGRRGGVARGRGPGSGSPSRGHRLAEPGPCLPFPLPPASESGWEAGSCGLPAARRRVPGRLGLPLAGARHVRRRRGRGGARGPGAAQRACAGRGRGGRRRLCGAGRKLPGGCGGVLGGRGRRGECGRAAGLARLLQRRRSALCCRRPDPDASAVCGKRVRRAGTGRGAGVVPPSARRGRGWDGSPSPPRRSRRPLGATPPPATWDRAASRLLVRVPPGADASQVQVSRRRLGRPLVRAPPW